MTQRARRLRRRRLTIVGAGLLALILLWRLGALLLAKPALAQVEAGGLESRWQGEVVVRRVETVQVSPVGGRLIALVAEGDAVAEGDPVAEVLPGAVAPPPPSPAPTGELDEARWQETQAELKEVRSRLVAAAQAWNNARGVPELMAEHQATLDAYAAEEQRLASRLTQLEIAAGRAVGVPEGQPAPPPVPTGGELLVSQQPGQISFHLDGQEGQLGHLSLAQFDQIIAQGAAEAQAGVRAGEAAFKVVDPTQYAVIAALPQETALTLQPQQKVELTTSEGRYTLEVLPFEVTGERNLVVFQGQGLPKEFLSIRSATVTLGFGRVEGVLVPNTALVEEAGYLGVRVWQGRKAVFTPVQLLGSDGTMAAVLGPSAGQRVVVK